MRFLKLFQFLLALKIITLLVSKEVCGGRWISITTSRDKEEPSEGNIRNFIGNVSRSEAWNLTSDVSMADKNGALKKDQVSEEKGKLATAYEDNDITRKRVRRAAYSNIPGRSLGGQLSQAGRRRLVANRETFLNDAIQRHPSGRHLPHESANGLGSELGSASRSIHPGRPEYLQGQYPRSGVPRRYSRRHPYGRPMMAYVEPYQYPQLMPPSALLYNRNNPENRLGKYRRLQTPYKRRLRGQRPYGPDRTMPGGGSRVGSLRGLFGDLGFGQLDQYMKNMNPFFGMKTVPMWNPFPDGFPMMGLPDELMSEEESEEETTEKRKKKDKSKKKKKKKGKPMLPDLMENKGSPPPVVASATSVSGPGGNTEVVMTSSGLDKNGKANVVVKNFTTPGGGFGTMVTTTTTDKKKNTRRRNQNRRSATMSAPANENFGTVISDVPYQSGNDIYDDPGEMYTDYDDDYDDYLLRWSMSDHQPIRAALPVGNEQHPAMSLYMPEQQRIKRAGYPNIPRLSPIYEEYDEGYYYPQYYPHPGEGPENEYGIEDDGAFGRNQRNHLMKMSRFPSSSKVNTGNEDPNEPSRNTKKYMFSVQTNGF